MKFRTFLLSFVLFSGVLSGAQADNSDHQVAFETVPIGAQSASMLLRAMNVAPALPRVSPSQQLGNELSKMFQEGAAKLDVPRPAIDEDQAVANGSVPTGGRTLNVMAYSYCLNGRTASGRYTNHGCVAVDTRVIPMGSKLYIPGYGWAVAADTGGAIVGNKIDVWFPSSGQCYQWGVRPVAIQVFPR